LEKEIKRKNMIRKAGATTQKTAILLLLSLIACSAPKNSATAKIINPQTGNVLGEARFIDTKKGVFFKIELRARVDTGTQAKSPTEHGEEKAFIVVTLETSKPIKTEKEALRS
jgi:hypothetical protein